MVVAFEVLMLRTHFVDSVYQGLCEKAMGFIRFRCLMKTVFNDTLLDAAFNRDRAACLFIIIVIPRTIMARTIDDLLDFSVADFLLLLELQHVTKVADG